MVVCISSNLKSIGNDLKSRGYIVVEELNGIDPDAIICNIKEGELTSIINTNSLKREGTLIIDYGSKSIDDIENILNNRTNISSDTLIGIS